jgi:transcriptional regulator with XRE-family HTH domain
VSFVCVRIGRRLARLRRERGLTQAQLAERIGILQTLVTDYEHDRLRLSAEMAVTTPVSTARLPKLS